MIKIRARSGESVQQMMKRFKKICEKEGLIKDIKRQSDYEKPSDKRRSRACARPASQRVDLGDLSFGMAAADGRYSVIEAGRFLQGDGTIRVTCTDDGMECKAFTLPAE